MSDNINHPVEKEEDVTESYTFDLIPPVKSLEDAQIPWDESGEKTRWLSLLTTDGVFEIRITPGIFYEGWSIPLPIPEEANSVQLHMMNDASLSEGE